MISINASVIRIDEIDLQDHTFKISMDKDLALLSESIQQLGLLVPPLLWQNKTGYTIISGFRRIAACIRLKFRRIPAGVLNGASGPLQCARAAVAANSFQRDLNLIETSRALNLLARFITEPYKIETLAASLGLPGNLRLIRKIQKIQGLPESMQAGVLEDRISLDMALKLSSLGEKEGRALLGIFDELSLSRNKQKELLTHMEEISIRDDSSIGRLLASNDVQDILTHRDADRMQKTKRLRDFLKKRRYPHLYFAEKQFVDALNTLKLGNRISLRPPDSFEGDSFSLHITFKGVKELESHVKALNQLTQDPLLTDLLHSQ